jgi:hypothetical protein
MRRLVLLAVLLVPLAAAAPALGKEVMSVTACGSDGCSTTRDGALMRAMTDVGPPTDAPAQPGAFYRLRITVGAGDEIAGHDRLSWVPSAGVLLARDGTWIAARPEIRAGLDDLTRGHKALPASRLAGFPPAAAEPSAPQPPEDTASASSDAPVWIAVTAAVALLLAGLLVLGRSAGRRRRALGAR